MSPKKRRPVLGPRQEVTSLIKPHLPPAEPRLCAQQQAGCSRVTHEGHQPCQCRVSTSAVSLSPSVKLSARRRDFSHLVEKRCDHSADCLNGCAWR